MKILVTGGSGYIGSHTAVELIDANYDVVLLDNFSNSSANAVNQIRKITGKKPQLIECDLRDTKSLSSIFQTHNFDAVIHFAGLKSVNESLVEPIKYYDNNVYGTINLLKIMKEHDVKKIVFSSSATVYGEPKILPIPESHPIGSQLNPYGSSKRMSELILHDLHISDKEWRIMILRYFNPVGAHESGLIGENPIGIPNNLIPYVSQSAIGLRPYVNIFGNDYDTDDGTGVRDYVHVVDLANAHIKGLQKLFSQNGYYIVNIGTGIGYSVLQIIEEFGRAAKMSIPIKFAPRRKGDVSSSYANPNYAKKCIGWEAQRNLRMMCEDSWRWQKFIFQQTNKDE